MADNAARARDELYGQRRAIREHVDKYRRYTEKYEKDFALKTIRNAQVQISKLKSRHSSLSRDSSWGGCLASIDGCPVGSRASVRQLPPLEVIGLSGWQVQARLVSNGRARTDRCLNVRRDFGIRSKNVNHCQSAKKRKKSGTFRQKGCPSTAAATCE